MVELGDAFIKKGIEICEIIDQIIGLDNKSIIEVSKAYCKYCLRLNKDEVNRLYHNFYEECENYLESINKSKILEKLFQEDEEERWFKD